MPELYQPICRDCDEAGEYTLATHELEWLWERYPACQRHFDEANERWMAREPVNLSEQMSAAYALDRSQK